MKSQARTLSIVASSLLAGSLLLTGCGGGGGGGDDTTATTSSVTLSGTATDELIVNGVVTAHRGSASGEVLATGRTDDHGTYTLSVEGYTGVVVVKVECDGNSTLYFPDTDSTETCDPNLRLYSATPVNGSGELNVSVTPLTQAMFAMATGGDENATLDPDRIDEARNTIALAIGGVDPVAADPLKNPVYKTVVEAFQKTAREEGVSTLQIIEKFAEDAVDGTLGDENAEVLKLIAENIAEENITVPFVEAVENNETYTPPANAAELDDIEEAKAFFETLRTQGESLVGAGGFFDTEAKAIEAALENVTMDADLASKAVENVLLALGSAIGEGVDTYTEAVVVAGEDNRTVTVERTGATAWNYTFVDNRAGVATTVASGTLSVPDINYSDPYIINDFETLTAAFEGTIPGSYFYESQQRVQTFRADVTLTRTDEGADAAIENIELGTEDGTKVGIAAVSAALGYDYNDSNEEDPVTPTYLKLESVTLNGALDSSYSATGTLNVTYTQNASLAENGGITEVFTTAADGGLDCADTDAYTGTVSYTLNGTPLTMNVQDGRFHVEIEGEYSFNDIEDLLRLEADNFTYAPDTCREPVYTLEWVETYGDEKIGNSGYLPSRLTFEGSLQNRNSGSELLGNVTVDLLNAATLDLADVDHAEGDPHLKAVVSGTLKRSGLADTLLNLTYQNSVDENNSLTGHVIQAAYTYGTTGVTVNGTLDKDMQNGSVSVASGNGLAITIQITEGDIDYEETTPLTKDGKTVGTLDNETGVPRIKYIDGTFESLP